MRWLLLSLKSSARAASDNGRNNAATKPILTIWFIRIIPVTLSSVFAFETKVGRKIDAKRETGNHKVLLFRFSHSCPIASCWRADGVRDLFRTGRVRCEGNLAWEDKRYDAIFDKTPDGGSGARRAVGAGLCRDTDAVGAEAGHGLWLRQGRQDLRLQDGNEQRRPAPERRQEGAEGHAVLHWTERTALYADRPVSRGRRQVHVRIELTFSSFSRRKSGLPDLRN